MFNIFSLFRTQKVELKVLRFKFTELSTIGELYLNGTLFGYTLEDKDRGLTNAMSLQEIQRIKESKVTCIPYGTYKIELYNSPKHKFLVPLLKEVPGFEYIEIEIGNYSQDSNGCILVGSSFRENMVQNSKVTFNKLMQELVKYKEFSISIQKKV